jgi:hypothetical protein
MMPDPDSHLGALSEYEIKLFKKWIQQGAHYETHWAYTPPKKVSLPDVSDKDWVRNEIVSFHFYKSSMSGIWLPMKKPIKKDY